MADFPTPDELQKRYEEGMGFKLEDPAAKPLLMKYSGGEATRRYYQDAAIRAAFEKIAFCKTKNQQPRALLSPATGSGKTFIAVRLLKRIADAGQLKRALFVCDRDELRTQGIEDGYLAACEILKGRVNLDQTGITIDEIMARSPKHAITGAPITRDEVEDSYEKTTFENRIMLPDRVWRCARIHSII